MIDEDGVGCHSEGGEGRMGVHDAFVATGPLSHPLPHPTEDPGLSMVENGQGGRLTTSLSQIGTQSTTAFQDRTR